MYIIYNLLMIGAFFLVMPYFIYRSICEKGFTRRMRRALAVSAMKKLKPLRLRAVFGFTVRPLAKL